MGRKSRVTQWEDACVAARQAFDNIEAAWAECQTALETLGELKSEFEDWQGNLPENLQNSALGEKLEAVVNLDLEPDLDLSSVDEAISDAESVELPLGFGRD